MKSNINALLLFEALKKAGKNGITTTELLEQLNISRQTLYSLIEALQTAGYDIEVINNTQHHINRYILLSDKRKLA